MALFLQPNKLGPRDYSVIWREPDGRQVSIGRIFFRANTGGVPSPSWFWTVGFHQRVGRPEPHHDRADTKEAALAAFKACWESADVPVQWPPGLTQDDRN